MEKKKTAIDWLAEQIKLTNKEMYAQLQKEIEQAKQMEKEQITEAHLQGLYSEIKMRGEKQAEQYYNENYGTNNN